MRYFSEGKEDSELADNAHQKTGQDTITVQALAVQDSPMRME
jgi:hypothetical protein